MDKKEIEELIRASVVEKSEIEDMIDGQINLAIEERKRTVSKQLKI